MTNLSEEDWTDLSVYAASSPTAITTEEELVAAEQSPVGIEPGDYQRIVEPGLFVGVGDLGPGESTRYRLRIPRDQIGLPSGPGVYRLGVQVLGTEDGGRASGADGRARVLVAWVPRSGPRTDLALAVQLRRRTVRSATGEVDRVGGWDRALGRSGRLQQLVRLIGSAGDYPLTTLIDPAVVEAVGTLAEGNPGIALDESTIDGVDELTGDITEDPPPSPSPGDPAAEDGEAQDLTPSQVSTATEAVSWLQELQSAAGETALLALPYGDLDVAAAAHHGDQGLIGRSLTAGISTLAEYGLPASGVVAPRNGLLPPEASPLIPRGVPALVTRRSLRADPEGGAATDGATNDGAVGVPPVLTGRGPGSIWTYRAIRTSPGTAARTSALHMRQRVLARAAVRSLTQRGEPLVVALPPQWQPGDQWARSSFFAGLRAPWLRPVGLDDLEPDTEAGFELRYPKRQLGLEVPEDVFTAARRLAETGAVLGGLVVDNDALEPRVQRQAMLGLSFFTRGHVPGMTGRLRAADNVVTARLRGVEVLAPPFIRMSSETGSFLVPVANRLDVPVRVQLRPEVTEPGLTLEVPDPVTVPPDSRRPIRVQVRARTIGIRSARLDLVTASGDRLYVGPTISLRSSQVAQWVWVAMAVGGGVLFVAIVLRIMRRVRVRRATHGPRIRRDVP